MTVRITKMDGRYSLKHKGFTHEVAYGEIREKFELIKFFESKYGPNRIYADNSKWPGWTPNTNWHFRSPKRGKHGGRFYVKHEADLTLLALKFAATLKKRA